MTFYLVCFHVGVLLLVEMRFSDGSLACGSELGVSFYYTQRYVFGLILPYWVFSPYGWLHLSSLLISALVGSLFVSWVLLDCCGGACFFSGCG